MKYLPLQVRVEKQNCLIVGGGNLALRRLKSLLSAGAIVDVIAPDIQPDIRRYVQSCNGMLIEGYFRPALIKKKYILVVAASSCSETNFQVGAYARENGILVNRVDNADEGDFIFPAVIDRDPITISISNNGASPVLSKLIKRQLSKFIPDSYTDLSKFVRNNRKRVSKKISLDSSRAEFWQHVLQGVIADAISSGDEKLATQLFDRALQNPLDFTCHGEVYLIGAGPGDPELLTLRAFRLIQQSDVILYDRLVSDEIMALVPEQAECIYVGKRRADHSVPQTDINQLLVDHASKGKRVARLKGGDPFIFGRGGEEIEKLVDSKISFQVVPGITAAIGCSAYAGIPLTHRDYAQSVQFVTGQLKDGSINLNWRELIADDKTLVFYMGLNSLPVICQALIENGMSSDMNVALVEKGTTSDQRVLVSILSRLPEQLMELEVLSPSLFIVGRVVKLAEKLHWYGERLK
ncbi:MAG: uroporphyrin-III C-methyltransferase/precorrin-2 dehydrogenase/sirohydrochlorin ferrochelatase [Gammaproteobacteria bacterium]|jgi:uroporphyrin-III C-methyltransferase/precorrin-2 dehydrogenase/sirohydrochlorin ferrochelatase